MISRMFGVVVGSVTLMVALVGVPSAQAGSKVSPDLFGLHSFSGKPGVSTVDLRLNCSPLWRDVEPEKGKYDWSSFDSLVNQAQNSWGIPDLMYVSCGTPQWAGGKVKVPSSELMGPGTTAAPKKVSYYKKYMTKVVKRYKGKIKYYQAWNEATSPQFYQGSPKKMAKMTAALAKVVKKHDSKAKVVSASVQTHDSKYEKFAPDYFRELKKQKWPFQVAAGHFYPAGKGGPDKRLKQISMFQQDLKSLGMPKKKKIWDTEANFWTDQPSAGSAGKVTGKKAATYLARNYLDTLRTGLKRSYWYMWTIGDQDLNFPGVQLRTGDPATAAWQELYGWIVGSKYQGCDTKGKLVRCKFKGSDGKFQIAFTTKGKTTINTKGKEACPVYGGECQTGKKTTIKKLPKRIS